MTSPGLQRRQAARKSPSIVVVGGGAVGAGVAARARRRDEHARIILVEREPDMSRASCGLPYYLGGVISDRDDLVLHTPETFVRRFDVEVRTEHELAAIDRARNVVLLRDRTDTLHEERYRTLVLATGARPLRPAVPGVDLPGVFTVRTVDDVDRIRAWIEGTPGRVVVVGAGFIGVEAAENLARVGLTVTLVERESQVLPPFDCEMTGPVLVQLEELGVEVRLGTRIVAFAGEDRVTTAVVEDGPSIEADAVLLCLGVRPDVDVAARAGLELGATGALAVNERLQTSDPAIYAAGDAAEVVHAVTRLSTWIPLAGPAARQARVIGTNVTGGQDEFRGTLGTAIVSVGSVALGMTGLSEKAARAAGIDHYVSHSVGTSVASFFPGAREVVVKLVVERDSGRLLGGLVVGGDGVDKRVDVLATAVWAGLTVDDLTALDLCYAPPFSSARDPVVVAGNAAENVHRGTVVLASGFPHGDHTSVIDVRRDDEFAAWHLDGAIHIPLDELRDRCAELDRATDYVVYCQTGLRSYLACRILEGMGFKSVRNVSGGNRINRWRMLACRES